MCFLWHLLCWLTVSHFNNSVFRGTVLGLATEDALQSIRTETLNGRIKQMQYAQLQDAFKINAEII